VLYLYQLLTPGVLTPQDMHSMSELLACLPAPGWPGIFSPCELCGDKLHLVDDYQQWALFLTDTWFSYFGCMFPLLFLHVPREEEKRRKERNHLVLETYSFFSFYIFCNILFILLTLL
jgi:hypothetical protein